jgi:hypothetical protein
MDTQTGKLQVVEWTTLSTNEMAELRTFYEKRGAVSTFLSKHILDDGTPKYKRHIIQYAFETGKFRDDLLADMRAFMGQGETIISSRTKK